jgi:hypothetical protein
MEIVVSPEHLTATALALARAAAAVDDAALVFAHRAAVDTPRFGDRAVAGVALVNGRAADTVRTVGEDVSRLSQALVALATHYPRVDTSAMPTRVLLPR